MAIVRSHIRTIKPEFFLHTGIFDAELESGLPLRMAYIGLWTRADWKGRFHWDPRELKVRLLPYDDVDFSEILAALEKYGFVGRYEVENRIYGVIFTFLDHQSPNKHEKEQPTLPDPPLELAPQIVTEAEAKQRRRKKTRAIFTPPSQEDVQRFMMEERELPEDKAKLEAEKFVNNYQAKGWLLSGRTRMVDWKPAAINWLLNSHRFEANPTLSEDVARRASGWDGEEGEQTDE